MLFFSRNRVVSRPRRKRWIAGGTLIGALLLAFVLLSSSQYTDEVMHPPVKPRVVRAYDEAYYRARLDSLRRQFGHLKEFPPAYELQALLALSQYPELRHTRIRLLFVDRAMPLIAARPDPDNLFRRKENWQYNIIVSTSSAPEWELALLKNFSFNAQIGILGHELAHTLYYQDKHTADMLLIGLRYLLSKPYHAGFEQTTDRTAIAHGLGWQVYEYARHYRQNPRLSPAARKSIETNYLTPPRVLAYMKVTNLYGQ